MLKDIKIFSFVILCQQAFFILPRRTSDKDVKITLSMVSTPMNNTKASFNHEKGYQDELNTLQNHSSTIFRPTRCATWILRAIGSISLLYRISDSLKIVFK